jgi:DNA-binding PadR family transcriptional regulator
MRVFTKRYIVRYIFRSDVSVDDLPEEEAMFAAFGAGPCGRKGGFSWGEFGPGWGAHGRGGRRWRGRVFEQGDLKYVILKLLAEKPRHGYEVIKALEERLDGLYSPSPGSVYPTLALLEDLGFARAQEEEGGRKIYEITDAGRAHLEEHKGTVEDIFERMTEMGADFLRAPMIDLGKSFGELGRAAFRAATRGDDAKLQRIREVIERAAREIESF